MCKNLFYIFLSIIWIKCSGEDGFRQVEKSRGDYRIMFYNVENLFDTFNDSLKNDEEFLPDGEKQWNINRYNKKLYSIFKVIAAVGEESPPEIIGLCEIENRKVLSDLIFKTPLSKYEYNIIHKESDDHRGIDVALLYRKDKIKYISEDYLKVNLGENQATRDILYFEGAFEDSDTFHFFVNHWPSRRGGEVKSRSKRMQAASVLKTYIDSLQKLNICPKIIIMGDFNDTPVNKSLQSLVLTNPGLECNNLINLSEILCKEYKYGTYRYQAEWNLLDQFLVSSQLLIETGIYTKPDLVKIFTSEFLSVEDEKYGGTKPYRTYLGPRYLGGYSDHYPIYLDLFKAP